MAYINQDCVNAFAKKYKCKVQITTFNTMNEALSKLRSGLSFDLLVGATVDVLGQLIESKLVQPLNHSYIPNISQAWPDFTNPFYDQGWQYTVPYTIYTTGISWRKDLVDENPYTMKQPVGHAVAAQVQGPGRDPGRLPGGHQPRPDEERHLRPQHHRLPPDRAVPQDPRGAVRLVNVRIDNNDYTEVPDADTWIHHAWSGDMAAAGYYMPKGVPVKSSATGSPPTARGRSPTTPT